MRASRGEFRVPLPIRSPSRIARSCHGAVMIPINGRVTAAREYPNRTNPLREPIRSDQPPDQSLTMLDAESTIPSITPSENRFPPKTVRRNCGSSGKIISLATSLRKLTHPRTLTFCGNGWRRGGGLVSNVCGIRSLRPLPISERCQSSSGRTRRPRPIPPRFPAAGCTWRSVRYGRPSRS